jgi:hypothetical protein
MDEVKFCDTCPYISLDEAEQDVIFKRTGHKLDHRCKALDRRLYHYGFHPYLRRPDDCPKDKESVSMAHCSSSFL